MTPKGDGGVALGVDIGGTKVLGVAVGADGAVLAEHKTPTPRGPADPASAAEVADTVVEVLATLADRVGADGPVGVGAPGQVDRNGVLRLAPNLRGADRADLRALVADRMGGAFVAVENDANCATLAELTSGAARGAKDALVITLGTGIGGGLVVDGRVVTGARGFAGEVGHMVVDPTGPPCPCGGRGCWERFASGDGLGRLAREAAIGGRLSAVVRLAGGDPASVHGEHVTQAAAAGDPEAVAVFDDLGWWVALGLANLTAILDPEVFVLGGGLSEAGDLLFAPVQRAFPALVEGGPDRPPPAVVPAEMGERAGAIGAALAARAGGLSR